jgi:heptosyltransferase-2|tara:strand:- start:2835 stop:3944 length:1110 start_codon:yes stop_codon:yes gene_type:complete
MISLQREIDKTIGTAIINILSLSKQQNNAIPEEILFVKLWAIGESILTLPLIKQFKQNYPNTKITVLCRKQNKTVYENQDFIDEVILAEPKTAAQLIKQRKKYDLAFDLEPYLKLSAILANHLSKTVIGFSHGPRAKLYDYLVHYNDKIHVVNTYLNLLKPVNLTPKAPDKLLPLIYSKKDANFVDKFFNKLPKRRPIIGMTVTSAGTATWRRWSQENFAKLADQLIEKHNAIILIPDTKNHHKYIQKIIDRMTHKESVYNLTGSFSLKQLFRVIERCKVYISNDTGPMHISAAQGTDTIGLFGPNTPDRFAPYGKNNLSIYKAKESPVINPHLGSFKLPSQNWMEKITVTDVTKSVKKLLTKQKRRKK